MNIRPQDLGPKWQIALLQRRSFLSNGVHTTPSVESLHQARVGMIGHWWTHDLELSPIAAAATLSGFKESRPGLLSVVVCAATEAATLYLAGYFGQEGHTSATLSTILVGTGFAALWPTFPRIQMLGIVRKSVTSDEITTSTGQTIDPVERSYLGLIREVQQKKLPPDVTPELRGAIRALGQALSQLPPCSPVPDVVTLAETAAQKQAEANRETDAVISASLERQAAALRRSADIAERATRLVRRTATLRDELSAQIESLRLGLTSFQPPTGDMANLSSLAEAVQTVAVQAASLADARAELDMALEGKPFKVVNPHSVTQTLRAGGN